MPRLLTDGDNGIVDYLYVLLEKMGRDFSVCELCGRKRIRGMLHHTKYEGATLYDIRIVCRSCNGRIENLYLI